MVQTARSPNSEAHKDQSTHHRSICVPLGAVCVIICIRSACVFLNVALGDLRVWAFALLQDLDQLPAVKRVAIIGVTVLSGETGLGMTLSTSPSNRTCISKDLYLISY